jgi:hypothetical protein
MKRLTWIALLGMSVVSVGCSKRQPAAPAEHERELQKRAREQHEAEERAAKQIGTDNATAIKNYKGTQTDNKKPQKNATTKGANQR